MKVSKPVRQRLRAKPLEMLSFAIRVKRRLKSCLDQIWHNISQPWDLVFYSRAAIVDANITEICSAIEYLLLEAGVLGEEK